MGIRTRPVDGGLAFTIDVIRISSSICPHSGSGPPLSDIPPGPPRSPLPLFSTPPKGPT